MFNGIAPFSDVWKSFFDALLSGSLRKAISESAMALSDAIVEARDWQYGGHVAGKDGETKTLEIVLQCRFKPERLMAVEVYDDNKMENASLTSIVKNAFVGNKNQFPMNTDGIRSSFFTTSHHLPHEWSTGRVGQTIAVQFYFTKDRTVYVNLYGKAIL